MDGGPVGDYIDDFEEGQVVMIDNLARLDTNVWRYLLTPQRLAGTWRALCVIEGICTDVDRSLELNYPGFSQGNWMRPGKDRVRIEAV